MSPPGRDVGDSRWDICPRTDKPARVSHVHPRCTAGNRRAYRDGPWWKRRKCVMSHRTLIAYASRARSTAEVAETIGNVLRECRIDADVRSVQDVTDIAD